MMILVWFEGLRLMMENTGRSEDCDEGPGGYRKDSIGDSGRDDTCLTILSPIINRQVYSGQLNLLVG